MDPGLQLTSVSPHDIFALAATGVCSKKFYETLFARAATAHCIRFLDLVDVYLERSLN